MTGVVYVTVKHKHCLHLYGKYSTTVHLLKHTILPHLVWRTLVWIPIDTWRHQWRTNASRYVHHWPRCYL